MTMKNFYQTNNITFCKYLNLIVGIYCLSFILPTILLKRSIVIPYFGVVPISILFTGTYFVLLDIITEVYGYFEAKKTLYAGIIVYSLFVFTMEGITHINQPLIYALNSNTAINNQAYNLIFNNIYATWLSIVICTLTFDIFNIRLLSKMKFLLKGKYFIIRSVLSSSFAIILFSFVTNFVAFYQQIIETNFRFYWEVNIISISAKIISLVICSYPALIISQYLKKVENLDVTYNINIFSFKDNLNS